MPLKFDFIHNHMLCACLKVVARLALSAVNTEYVQKSCLQFSASVILASWIIIVSPLYGDKEQILNIDLGVLLIPISMNYVAQQFYLITIDIGADTDKVNFKT